MYSERIRAVRGGEGGGSFKIVLRLSSHFEENSSTIRQDRVVRKPVDANPGLKVQRSIDFSCKKSFKLLWYVKCKVIQTQDWKTNNINRKRHRKVTNMKSKLSLILG